MAHEELLEVGSPRWPRSDRGYVRILDLDLDRDARRQPSVGMAPAERTTFLLEPLVGQEPAEASGLRQW